jgi:hypothetical protein
MKSNQDKYGHLLQELARDYNEGRDSHPDSLLIRLTLHVGDGICGVCH